MQKSRTKLTAAKVDAPVASWLLVYCYWYLHHGKAPGLLFLLPCLLFLATNLCHTLIYDILPCNKEVKITWLWTKYRQYTLWEKKVINMSRVQKNSEYGLAYMYVTQWLEHSTSVWKVIGSNSYQGHRFFFVPHSWHVDYIFPHFFTELKIFHHSLYHCTNNVFIFHGDHSSHSLILRYY